MVQFTKVCQQKSVLTPFSVDDTLFGSSKISVGVGGSRIPDHNRENSPICEILFSLWHTIPFFLRNGSLMLLWFCVHIIETQCGGREVMCLAVVRLIWLMPTRPSLAARVCLQGPITLLSFGEECTWVSAWIWPFIWATKASWQSSIVVWHSSPQTFAPL